MTDQIERELKRISDEIAGRKPPENAVKDSGIRDSLLSDQDDIPSPENETQRNVIKELVDKQPKYLINYHHEPGSSLYPGTLVKMFIPELLELRTRLLGALDNRYLENIQIGSNDDIATILDLIDFIDVLVSIKKGIEVG